MTEIAAICVSNRLTPLSICYASERDFGSLVVNGNETSPFFYKCCQLLVKGFSDMPTKSDLLICINSTKTIDFKNLIGDMKEDLPECRKCCTVFKNAMMGVTTIKKYIEAIQIINAEDNPCNHYESQRFQEKYNDEDYDALVNNVKQEIRTQFGKIENMYVFIAFEYYDAETETMKIYKRVCMDNLEDTEVSKFALLGLLLSENLDDYETRRPDDLLLRDLMNQM